MQYKIQSLFLGMILVMSLGLGGSIYAQTPEPVVHQTGDILVYDTDGYYSEYRGNYFEIYDLDNDTTLHYSEGMFDFLAESMGEAVVTLVSAEDLDHLPEKLDPTQDPEFNPDASLFGMQIENSETVQGEFNGIRNEFDISRADDSDDGWQNGSHTDTFGPEHRNFRSFDGGISVGDYSLLPLEFDQNRNQINITTIVFGDSTQNFTMTEPMWFPIFGDQWIEINVTIDVGFYKFFDEPVLDATGVSHNVDVHGAEIMIYAESTNNTIHVPLGDPYDSDTQWVPVNATVYVQRGEYREVFIERDEVEGIFFGFDEFEWTSVWGSLENDSTQLLYPHEDGLLSLDDHGVNISVYSDFYHDGAGSLSVRLRDFMSPGDSVGTNPGLETGDELHYQAKEHTTIDFFKKDLEMNNPDGDGPDLNNIQYIEESFLGTVDASYDFWVSVYKHTADSVGFILETLFTDIVVAGFPEDDQSSGIRLDQDEHDGQDGPLYFVEIVPLLPGDDRITGIGSTASQEILIPVEEEQYPQVSDLLRLGNENDNRDGDDDLMAFLFGITRELGVDLSIPMSADEHTLALHNVTVNGFEYVVLGDNDTYIYEFSTSGSAPFDLDPDHDDHPPATIEFTFDFSIVDTRVYDNDTGALVLKGDYTDLFVHTQIIADLSGEPDVDIDELLVQETKISYKFSSELSLSAHSKDYQEAQDPADIPEDPNAEPPVTTTNTTDGGDDLELPVPGFELPITLMAVAISILYIRKFRR